MSKGVDVNQPDAVRYKHIQGVLWRVMILYFAVAREKIIAGLLSGALSMVADGFHSVLDASSNIVGIAGTGLAARPADEDHPYGHRRFETIATLSIGGLLLVAAWEILKAAVERIGSGSPATASPVSLAVMLCPMAVQTVVTSFARPRSQ